MEKYLIQIESSTNKKHPWTGKPTKEAEKIFSDMFPAIYAHFNKLRKKLIKRSDKGEYFWELRACAYWDELENEKIVWPDIAKRSEFTLDQTGSIIDMTLFTIPESDPFLLGILNSKVTEWRLRHISSTIQHGYLRFKRIYIKDTPIPVATESQKEDIRSLVVNVLDKKYTDRDVDVSALEREIDELVYRLYGLTPAEIALVEGREPPAPPIPPVRSNDFSRSTAEAVTTNEGEAVTTNVEATTKTSASAPPFIFTGQPPQGSFREKLARLETLTKQATPAAIQELVAALTDDNLTIRWQAGAALRAIGGPEVAGALRAFIAQTENAQAMGEAEKILTQLK